MNCRKVTHLLSAYIDGELAGVEHMQIREHLALCQDCCGEHRELLQMKRLVGAMQMQRSREDLPDSILKYVRADVARTERASVKDMVLYVTDWMRMTVIPVKTFAVGVGFAACVAGAILQFGTVAGPVPQPGLAWEPVRPSAEDLTSGTMPASATRFVSAPAQITPVSASSDYPYSAAPPMNGWVKNGTPVTFDRVVFGNH